MNALRTGWQTSGLGSPKASVTARKSQDTVSATIDNHISKLAWGRDGNLSWENKQWDGLISRICFSMWLALSTRLQWLGDAENVVGKGPSECSQKHCSWRGRAILAITLWHLISLQKEMESMCHRDAYIHHWLMQNYSQWLSYRNHCDHQQ